jgi:hypothetical protein
MSRASEAALDVAAPDGAESAARNEDTFRRINEAIRAGRRTRDGRIGFVCECGRLGCTDVVELSLDDYEGVRADGTRFIIVLGHQLDVEEVVEIHAGHAVVAKRGRAGEAAEDLDPRSALDGR